MFPFLAESVIEDMVGPDWKKRWLYWTGRTKEQVKGKNIQTICSSLPLKNFDYCSAHFQKYQHSSHHLEDCKKKLKYFTFTFIVYCFKYYTTENSMYFFHIADT